VVGVDRVVAAIAPPRARPVVEDPPMEEIVSAIYAQRRRGRGHDADRFRAARKYAAIALASARRALASAACRRPSALPGVILFIFARVETVLRRARVAGGRPGELLWYLAITEWCLLGAAGVPGDRADVRSGDVAPPGPAVSYLARSRRALGETACACSCSVRPRRRWPGCSPAAGLPIPVVSAALPLGARCERARGASTAAIGLSAFWIVDTSPSLGLAEFAFVLGDFCCRSAVPEWLRALALPPFPAMLWGRADGVRLRPGGVERCRAWPGGAGRPCSPGSRARAHAIAVAGG
jgi:hypothetical protein